MCLCVLLKNSPVVKQQGCKNDINLIITLKTETEREATNACHTHRCCSTQLCIA